MYDQCENMRKSELGQSSQLRTTLRIHILVLILHAAATNPKKSQFHYPTIAKGVYLSKYVFRKVPLSRRCWQHQCSSQPVQKMVSIAGNFRNTPVF